MANELKNIAVVPGESNLTRFQDLDARWNLIKQQDLFLSDTESDQSDCEEEFCDAQVGVVEETVSPSSSLTSSSAGSSTQAGIGANQEMEVLENTPLFAEIVNKMQLLTSSLQLKGVPLNLCIVFISNISMALHLLDIDKLKEER